MAGMYEGAVSGACAGGPTLAWGDIHVWHTALDLGPQELRQLEATLAPEEKLRADGFRFARDRNHFVAARGILRRLLGSYLDRSPAEVEFAYGPRGKPALKTADGSDAGVCFNLSHSHGLAVYAIARDRNLGIDVELVRPEITSERIAGRYFSAREKRDLHSLPPEQRAEGVFLCWTRKEAYLKALGTGLQVPLASFDVTVTPGMPAQFLAGVEPSWHVAGFAPAQEYVAAVVYDGGPCQIKYFSSNEAASG